MSDDFQEKTEEATSKKLEDARLKGRVAKSNDLTTGALLLSATLFLYFLLPYMGQQMLQVFVLIFTHLSMDIKSTEEASYWFQTGIFAIASILGPLFILLFITSLAVMIFQVGFVLSTENLQMRWKSLNIFDVSNYKKYFDAKAWMRVFLGMMKTGSIGFVGYWVISSEIGAISKTMNGSASQILSCFLTIAFRLCFISSLILFIFGCFDWFYQKLMFAKEMRMSKQEIKDERKQSEGDVQVKSRMRSMLQSFLRSRIKTEVPKADVIITNPIHYAIAIRYDSEKMPSPICVAKGSRKMALKIKEIAKESGVPIVENPPLARSLYKAVEVGAFIPAPFFHSVAEVLAYVYRMSDALKKKRLLKR
ncbi:MAG: flhB [Chlamydiales bacterium]|jgi:flagellar biosynthetic protein FlhB|nr:flhB [Chlamydiales bacterium]